MHGPSLFYFGSSVLLGFFGICAESTAGRTEAAKGIILSSGHRHRAIEVTAEADRPYNAVACLPASVRQASGK